MSPDLLEQARGLLDRLRAQELMLATAESCTGGLICACLTEIPGSSNGLDRGFVTYSNEAKTQMLGVPIELIASKGAVSEEVACAMAEGALKHSGADIAVSVTGIAGPGGGSAEKPVGLVHFAVARRGGVLKPLQCAYGDLGRSQIREKSVEEAFRLVRSVI